MSNVFIPTKPIYLQPLCKQFFEASPYSHLPYDYNYVLKTITKCLSNTQEYLILAIGDQEKPVGMLAAQATPMAMSPHKVACELMWYVEPEYRGSLSSVRMLEGYEYWAKNVANCIGCQMICLDDIMGEKLAKLYTRRGYSKTEQVFFKWI